MYLIPILLIAFLCYLFRDSLFKKDFFKSASTSFSKGKKLITVEDKYNEKKVKEQNELNTLLEKINQKGYDNLSEKEKNRLDTLSKN